MVEAPRIRLVYQKIKHIKLKKIIDIFGPTYLKFDVNLVGYQIIHMWFCGKYIYIAIKKNNTVFVLQTHMLMYGRIIIKNTVIVNPKLRPNLTMILDNGETIIWYLSQIKLLDPTCTKIDITTNYGKCTSKQILKNSKLMKKYDFSHPKYNQKIHYQYLIDNLNTISSDNMVDFLLNQKYFPGIGNIVQQEALYCCQINPNKKVNEINNNDIKCLLKKLKCIVDNLFEIYSKDEKNTLFKIYHKGFCPLGHKTITKILGKRERRTTWCPICQKI